MQQNEHIVRQHNLSVIDDLPDLSDYVVLNTPHYLPKDEFTELQTSNDSFQNPITYNQMLPMYNNDLKIFQSSTPTQSLLSQQPQTSTSNSSKFTHLLQWPQTSTSNSSESTHLLQWPQTSTLNSTESFHLLQMPQFSNSSFAESISLSPRPSTSALALASNTTNLRSNLVLDDSENEEEIEVVEVNPEETEYNVSVILFLNKQIIC